MISLPTRTEKLHKRQFPGSAVVRTLKVHGREHGERRSHMPQGTVKKKKKTLRAEAVCALLITEFQEFIGTQ